MNYWVCTEGGIDVWIERHKKDPSCSSINAEGPFDTLTEAKKEALNRLQCDARTIRDNRRGIKNTKAKDFRWEEFK